MTQNWKKLLSLLLVLTMLAGMMPAVFAAEEEPAAAPEQAEEILTEEPADPEVPAEPETPEEPAEPAEPEEPAPAAEEEATPLTLKAADALRLEGGKVWLVLTAENGAPEALTVRIAPKPAEGEAVAEDAWTEATVAPNEAGEYLFEIAVAGLEAGDWVLEAACGEAVLTVEVSLVSDAEAEAVAVDGYTVTLPAPAEDEPVDAEEPADVVEEPGEPADEAGEPDLAGEPEDDTEFDIEIMSEAVSARKEVPVSSSLLDFGYAKYDQYGRLFTHFYISSSFFGTYPDVDGLFVIAKAGSIRYYLTYYSKAGITPDDYNYPFLQNPLLPAGSYDLLMGGLTADGNLVVTQPLGAKLIVLPAPEVSLGTYLGGTVYDASIKLPKDMSNISELRIEPGAYYLYTDYLIDNAVKGVFTKEFGYDDDYIFWYRGPDISESTSGDIIIPSATSTLAVPASCAPWYLQSYFIQDGSSVGLKAENPLILNYKGAMAQIVTIFAHPDGADAVNDTRLTYTSNNKKVVTVDEVGNVTAVGEGETTITVTTVCDDPFASDTVYVKVEPVTPKTFKFNQTKLTGAVNKDHQSLQFTLSLEIDSKLPGTEIPVTYTVTGGDGLKIYEGTGNQSNFNYYENPHYGTKPSNGCIYYFGSPLDKMFAEIRLMATEGGHYTVTAEALGKTATCTVDIDGFSAHDSYFYPTENSEFYKGGKSVTGWISWQDNEGKYFFGKDCFKAPSDWGYPSENFMAVSDIFYINSSSKHPYMQGIHKIGGKPYAFYDGCLALFCDDDSSGVYRAMPGVEYTWNPYAYDNCQVYVAGDGHLLTGWQDTGTGYAYFDPATCFMATNTWVPVRNGKGVTWVNEYGEPKDDHGNSLDNADTSPPQYQDGFHGINGEPYFFDGGYKKGARQTGWVYVKKDGSNWVPADTKTGTAKIYCDPNRNGAVAMSPAYGKTFWADGKEYCGDYSLYGYCIVLLPGPYTGKTDVKYLDTGAGFILGPDGSIAKNALVKAYSPYDGGHIFYAYLDAYGDRTRDEWVTINGKNYYFDDSGCLEEGEFAAGLYVKEGSSYQEVTAAPAKAGKPQEGFLYYYKGEKLKNIILYNVYSDGGHPAVILDKNGKAVTDAIASGRTACDSSSAVIRTYIVNAEGHVMYPGGYPASGSWYYTVEVKGKLYAVHPETGEILKDGLVPIEWTSSEKVAAFGYADKNGVLARNTFKEIPEGFIYLDEKGTAVYSEDRPLVVKGKAYYSTWVSKSYNGGPHNCDISVVYKPAKAGWLPAQGSWTAVTVPDMVYVNKDGSLKTGLLTRQDGKKAYFTVWGESGFRALNDFNGAPYPVIWRIGGKLYAYNSNFEPVTGWVHFSDIGISEPEPNNTSYLGSDVLMYFDPKSGAAAAGGWKSLPIPVVIDDMVSWGAEGIAFPDAFAVNYSSRTAKLYFDANGVLVRDTELTIGGKVYMFASDGTSALKAGWTDANMLYYLLKNGQLATGRQKINGQYYFFDGTGSKVMNDLRKSGSKWYYYDMNGVQATPVLRTTASDGNLFGNASVQLTAVWAKDGSLSKIVYTHSGKPADGETVNFGSYDVDYDIYNSFLLDSKGLPMTGVVYGLLEDGISHARIFNADGSRVNGGNDGYSSLVQVGKTYYVMDGELVQTQSKLSAVLIDGIWDSLSEVDRKTLDFFEEQAYNRSRDLVVLVNPDGSVAADTAVAAMIGSTVKLWHTNRLGIPMDYYSSIYKFGGKWYVTDNLYRNPKYYGDKIVYAQIRVKDSGELTGIYDVQTGKALSGFFSDESYYIALKNGKPQTGTQKGPYQSYYFDPQTATYYMHP